MVKKILLLVALLGFYINCFAADKILVFGDSLSAGYGIDIHQGWVTLLQQRLAESNPDISVVNASISGNTTIEGLNRLSATLEREKPNFLILELGANDALRGVPLSTTRANLGKMIDMAEAQNIKVILVGLRPPPNFGPIFVLQVQRLFKDIAKEYKVTLVPQLLKGVDDNPQYLQADGLHPNVAAQPILFENMWQVLKTVIE